MSRLNGGKPVPVLIWIVLGILGAVFALQIFDPVAHDQLNSGLVGLLRLGGNIVVGGFLIFLVGGVIVGAIRRLFDPNFLKPKPSDSDQ